MFLCTTNSCRSQMAEAFARARGETDVEIASAGSEPTEINPLTARVMAEVGISLDGHRATALDELALPEFDVVVTLCARAAGSCPVMPGNPERVDWNLPDPAAVEGDAGEVLSAFRRSRDEIRRLVDDLFDRGYLKALAEGKSYARLVIDGISDGIIAHDMARRVFYFNTAAEEITGYRREEVVNHDCHDVFPGNFCGGKCSFCDGAVQARDTVRQELEIVRKDGERRFVSMTVKAMDDAGGRRLGVIASFHDMTRERRLARRVGEVASFAGIIGRDPKMLEVFDLIRDLADSNAPVLIHGESGTGKELVAAAIHQEGARGSNLFVPVNCGALPESLLESELFGHVKGAFTGAIRDKKGRFELADGGTIFLDEIGDITPPMQIRLLRVLQEGRFERVGSEKTLVSDVRVISATNKDLSEEIEEGRFREDLFYRLSVVPLLLPPLRERRNDIPPLIDHVLANALSESGRTGVVLAPETLGIMMSYDWPGNIRELQNWLQFALIKCKGDAIRPEHLPPPRKGADFRFRGSVKRRRRKLDAESVRAVLAQTDGNKLEAARLLGVARATLYRFLDDAGMDG